MATSLQYPLQYSCLENSMDRGAWWATVHGVGKSQRRLSHTHIHTYLGAHQNYQRRLLFFVKINLTKLFGLSCI